MSPDQRGWILVLCSHSTAPSGVLTETSWAKRWTVMDIFMHQGSDMRLPLRGTL